MTIDATVNGILIPLNLSMTDELNSPENRTAKQKYVDHVVLSEVRFYCQEWWGPGELTGKNPRFTYRSASGATADLTSIPEYYQKPTRNAGREPPIKPPKELPPLRG